MHLSPESNQFDLFSKLPKTFENLEKIFQEKGKQLSAEFEDKSWLKNDHPLGKPLNPIDWTLFGHLNGDAFIGGTPLEGYTAEKSTEYFHDFIDHLLQQQGDEYDWLTPHKAQLEKFRDDMKRAREISSDITGIATSGTKQNEAWKVGEIQGYAEALLKEFQGKKIGWIPCGWKTKNGESHAMMARINMEDGSVTIVNTGSGIKEHHPMIKDVSKDPLTGELKEEIKCQEFITIKDVDKKRLENPEFFKFLIQLNTRPVWDGTLQFDGNNIYKPLEKYLKGTVEKAVCPIVHPEMYKKPQRSGTCAVKSVSTTLYYTLCDAFESKNKDLESAVNCYKKIKYLWQTQALVDIADQLERDSGVTDSQKLLLEDVIDNIARSAEKLYHKGLLQDEDLQILHATLFDIQGKINRINHTAEVVEYSDPLPVDLTNSPELHPFVSVSTGDLLSTRNSSYSDRAGSTTNHQVEQLIGDYEAVINKLAQNTSEAEEICGTLGFLMDKLMQIVNDYVQNPYAGTISGLNSEDKKALKKAVLNRLAHFISSLPSPSRESDSFWNKVPEQQILQVMISINEMMTALKVFNKISDSYAWNGVNHTADLTAMNYTLLAINTQLAHRFPETGLEGFQINYYDLIYALKSPHFIITDPKLQKQLANVVRFFEPDFTLEKLTEITEGEILENEANALFSCKSIKNKSIKNNSITIFRTEFSDEDKGNYASQTLRYFKQQYDKIKKDPESQKELYARGIVFQDTRSTWGGTTEVKRQLSPSDSLGTHIAALINTPELIHESVRLLRETAIRCVEAEYGGNTSIIDIQNNGGYTPIKCKADSEEKSYTISFEGLHHQYLYSDNPDVNDRNLEKEYENRFGDTLVDGLKDRVKQNPLIARQDIHFDQSLDISREIEMLGVDPYDEVSRVTSFIQKNVHLLKTKEVQRLLKKHLFRVERIRSQLKDNPQIAKNLDDALIRAIEHYCHEGNLDTCLFLAEIGNQFKQFEREFNAKSLMSDYRSVLRDEILPHFDEELTDLLRIHEAVVCLYEHAEVDQIVMDEAAYDITSLSIYRTLHGPYNDQNEKKKTTAESVQMRLRPIFKEYIEDAGKLRALLDNLIKIVNADAVSQYRNWKGSYPTYTSDEYIIDLDEGKITNIYGDEFIHIPQSILRNDTFKAIFKDEIVTCEKRPGTDTYIINEGMVSELIVSGRSYLEFQKWIDGKYHRYVPSDKHRDFNAPTLITADTHLWATDNRIIGFNKDGARKLYIQGQQTGNSFEVERIKRYGADQKLDWSQYHIGFHRVDESLNYLCQLERRDQIECWTTYDGLTLSELHLKTMGLGFKTKYVDGKAYLYSLQFPGYFLVENPEIPALSKTPRFLTLQNMAGERKVLVPQVSVDPQFRSAPFDVIITQKMGNYGRCLEYEIKDGDLHSNKVEAQLYQMYLWAARGNYDKAYELMKGINPLERLVDNKEEGITERILLNAVLELLKEDKHPSASALYLHLILFVHKNELKYPLPINVERDKSLVSLETLFDACMMYGLNQTNTTTLRLSADQEKIAVEKIFQLIDEKIEKANEKKDKKEVEGLEQKKKELEIWLGTRRNALATGKVKVGARCFTIPEKPSMDQHAEKRVIQNKFEDFYTTDACAYAYDLPEYTIQDAKFFENDFCNLYKIATSGDAKEIEKLKVILALSATCKSNVYYALIQKVVANPRSYPSPDAIREAINNYEVANKAYHDANKAYHDSDWREVDHDALWRKQNDAEIAKDKIFDTFATKHTFFTWISGIFKMYVAPLVNMILTYVGLKGHFTLKTRVKELGRYLFASNTKLAKKIKPKQHTKVETEDAPLEKTDKAFDAFFDQIIATYFDCEEIAVHTNGSALPTTHTDKVVAKKLQQENEELQDYKKSIKPTKKVYTLKSEVTLEKIKKEIQKTADKLSEQLKIQKVALLWQVNDIPDHVEERSLKEIHQKGFRKQLTWDDIRKLTLKGSMEEFQRKTHLGDEEAQRLLAGTSDYLVKSSRLNQMQFVLNNIQKAESERDPERANLLLQTIAAGIVNVRSYVPTSENREQQWFEHANQYLYRKIQLEKMEEVTDPTHAEILAEMPTGFGKTKTLVPSADYKQMAEGKVVVNTWPSSLEMTNALDIKEQMKSSYGKKVDRLTFDRASSFTTESLKHLYKELKKDKRSGRPINVRSESLRALQLHAILSLNMAADGSEHTKELNKQIKYFLKILRLLRTSGWTSIDEAHVNLDPMDKLIYTIGDPTILPMQHMDLMEELFDFMIEEMSKNVNIAENLQSQTTEEYYMEFVGPAIAAKFAEKYGITKDQMESYNAFVLGTNGSVPEWLEGHEHREMIALVKGLVSHVLKSSLKGEVDKNYGLSKLHIKKKEYAISYHCANTPKENKSNPSQFKNPHETMCKTFMTYLHKGLSKSQIGKLIDFLKLQATAEAEDGTSIADTAANRFFMDLVPGSTKLLNRLNEKDIENLHAQLTKNKQAIFFYIKNIIAPQLKIYPEHLESTVHNYRTQFASSLSLSATPQDTATHGPNTVFVPMKGTSGQVTHLLLTKCKDPTTLHKLNSMVPGEVLEESLENIVAANPRIKATIDIGGLYKGVSNHEVAQKMRETLNGGNNVEAILFFDEKDGIFKIMDVASGKIHDPSESKVDPEVMHTFYDQSRCFGSDVKQAVDAVGLMMTDSSTTKAKAGQGAGRMRQWHMNQTVEVAYPGAIEDDIFGENPANIKDLLVYWIANQAKKEADKNYQSQMQQMDNEIRTALFDKILGLNVEGTADGAKKKPSVKDATCLFGKFKTEFFGGESCNPWNMYASIPEDRDTIECLEEYQKSSLDRLKKIRGLSKSEKKTVEGRINKYSEKWEEMALPEKVKANGPGMGLECEVLQEVEVEAELEIQAHTQEQVVERKARTWPEDLDLFQKGWEKPAKQNITLRRIGLKIDQMLPEKPASRVLSITAIGLASAVVTGCVLAIASIALPIILGIGAAIFLAGLGLGIGSMYIGKILTKGNPIYRVGDLMKLHLPSEVRDSSKLFSPNFLVSNNFYAQSTNSVKEPVQSPLNVEQKPLFSILVIMDELENGKTEVKGMAIDQNDSVFFRKKLQEDNESQNEDATQTRKRKVGVYDIHNGLFTAQGANPFSEEDLENEDLQSLIGQAKFLNGEIKYEDAEIEHFGKRIQDVAKDIGYGPLQSLFTDRILQYRPLNRKCLVNKFNPKPIAELLGLGTAAAA